MNRFWRYLRGYDIWPAEWGEVAVASVLRVAPLVIVRTQDGAAGPFRVLWRDYERDVITITPDLGDLGSLA